MVMPRSRSMSIESRNCARMSRALTAPVTSRIRSLSVVFPWSMWAMTLKLRMRDWSMGAFERTNGVRRRYQPAAITRQLTRSGGERCGEHREHDGDGGAQDRDHQQA